MNTRTRNPLRIGLALAALLLPLPGTCADDLGNEVKQAIALFQKTDPGLKQFFDSAAGYAVFPKVAKGAIGIGGAFGRGEVFANSKKIGEASLSQGTIGFQLGGQVYSEVIFFENNEALDSFKESRMEFSAQVSAVAAAEGVSRDAKYTHGVLIFTLAKSGLMFEASVGGQKFKFQPSR